MPENRKLVRVPSRLRLVGVGEADEMEDKSVDNLVRQVELLVN